MGIQEEIYELCEAAEGGARPVFTGTEANCMRWVHQNHCYSFAHALQHEGYTLRKVQEAPQELDTVCPQCQTPYCTDDYDTGFCQTCGLTMNASAYAKEGQ